MQNSSISDIPEAGFKSLGIRFSEDKISDLYHLFDEVCNSFEEDYTQHFSGLDQIITKFIEETNTPLANQTLKLKNLRIDQLKYKSRTSDEYNIFSYQYIPGLYQYISERLDNKNKFLNFFKEVDQLHIHIKDRLHRVIIQIEEKTKIATALKIWKHQPTSFNSSFLPVHFDRSIFTVIVHTSNQGEECLRIYPPRDELNFDEIDQKSIPSVPKKSDLPILFPGLYAKEYFSLNPTPHCVVSDKKISHRHSLVFFIARKEGW